MTQRKRWLKTREFEKGECVAVRRPGKADTDRNAKRPPFVCVLVWVYFAHERFESGFRDLTLCVKVLRRHGTRCAHQWETWLCAAASILVCGQFLQLCQPLHSNRPVC